MNRSTKQQPISYTSQGLALLTGFLLGVLALTYLAGEQLYDYKDTISQKRIETADLPRTDVIVCLAGGRGRIRVASDLWYQHWKLAKLNAEKTPILFISGMGEGVDWTAFAAQVRHEVLAVLPQEKVIMERKSVDTRGNAEKFVEHLKVRSQVEGAAPWRRMTLVTATYHMKRAVHLFRNELDAEGLEAVRIDTVSVAQEPFVSEKWKDRLYSIHITMMEFLKWIVVKTLG